MIDFVRERWGQILFASWQHLSLVVQCLLLATVIAVALAALCYRRRSLTSLANNVTAADANVEKIGMNERDGRVSVVQLVVSVHDRVHLARVIKKLRTIKGVTRITRVKA